MKLIHLDSSVLGANSVSRELGRDIVARWRRSHPGLQVQYRDLDADPVPHLDAATIAGTRAAGVDEGERVLRQFLDADVVVLGVPMYNFGIPSTLKAWIDRIAVAGRTFRYTADGPEGLAGGKRVIVALAAGGQHAGQPTDFVEPYLRQVFGFLGVRDLEFVRAEGVALSPARREAALAAAKATIARELPLAA